MGKRMPPSPNSRENSSSSSRQDSRRPTENSRKRQRQTAPYVFVGVVRVPFHEVVAFMNSVMHKEGFTMKQNETKYQHHRGDSAVGKYVGDAILDYRSFGHNLWRVQPATEELAEKLCYLNRIRFQNAIVHVKLDVNEVRCTPCRYSCWNEYHLDRYGRNEPAMDVEIVAHLKHPMEGIQLSKILNDKMRFFGLSRRGDSDSILSIRQMSVNRVNSFVLTMGSPEEAERILYLSLIELGGKTVRLQRANDWVGPQPRYKSYRQFLRARSDSDAANKRNGANGKSQKATIEATKRQNEKAPTKHAAVAIEILDDSDDDDDVLDVWDDNEEEKKLDHKNQRLLTVMKTLTNSNESKSRDIASLQSELNDLQRQLAECDDKIAEMRAIGSSREDEVATATEQVEAVHQSWQDQAVLLTEKQTELDDVQEQLQQLQRDSQNVTETLLDERTERQQIQDILARIQAQPLLQHPLVIVKKQVGEIESNGFTAAAIDGDQFDV